MGSWDDNSKRCKKMRIIAGDLKGRNYDAPPFGGKTHPMNERMKNAMFNILGDISDLSILDPFGGSGGVSFESLSRGARSSQIIERDRLAYSIISKNIEKLGLSDRAKVSQVNCSSWSKNNPDEKYDLIFANPPFPDPQLSTVSDLTRHLKSSSLIILCHPGSEVTPTVNGVVVVDNRNYGDAALTFYRLGSKD